MKKFFYIRDEINEELVNRFSEFLNSLNEDDEVVVGINSCGGFWGDALYISESLSRLQSVELVAIKELSSSALNLFLITKCKKKTVNTAAHGMWHRGQASICFHPGTNPIEDIEHEKYLDDLEVKFFSKILPTIKIENYKLGNDIFISNQELQKIAKLNLKK